MTLNQSHVKFNDLHTKTLQFSLFHTVIYCKALLNEQIEVCSAERKQYNCSVLSNMHTVDETSETYLYDPFSHVEDALQILINFSSEYFHTSARRNPLGVCTTRCGTNISFKTLYRYAFRFTEHLWNKSRPEYKILFIHENKFIHDFDPVNQKRRLVYHR